jgi:hypothetical protein
VRSHCSAQAIPPGGADNTRLQPSIGGARFVIAVVVVV